MDDAPARALFHLGNLLGIGPTDLEVLAHVDGILAATPEPLELQEVGRGALPVGQAAVRARALWTVGRDEEAWHALLGVAAARPWLPWERWAVDWVDQRPVPVSALASLLDHGCDTLGPVLCARPAERAWLGRWVGVVDAMVAAVGLEHRPALALVASRWMRLAGAPERALQLSRPWLRDPIHGGAATLCHARALRVAGRTAEADHALVHLHEPAGPRALDLARLRFDGGDLVGALGSAREATYAAASPGELRQAQRLIGLIGTRLGTPPDPVPTWHARVGLAATSCDLQALDGLSGVVPLPPNPDAEVALRPSRVRARLRDVIAGLARTPCWMPRWARVAPALRRGIGPLGGAELLAIVRRPPPAPDDLAKLPPAVWAQRVRVAAALLAAHLDVAPWADSQRRIVLLELFGDPDPGAAEAAVLALAQVALDEPEATDEVGRWLSARLESDAAAADVAALSAAWCLLMLPAQGERAHAASRWIRQAQLVRPVRIGALDMVAVAAGDDALRWCDES
ncbi:MAG: hypothetical protein H6733_01200 [Alphaproteobacteria bacterium]|nr:hypothetical protein [Alphaproteobacteria bacterium]